MAEREELTIRTAGGAVFLDGITLTEYTLTLNRMGMPSLTASVRYKECLDDAWTGDEYVDCMGERYWLRETPTSTKDSTDERYDHELNFVSEREKLAQTYFYDVVTDTGVDYKPITNSTEFKFWGTLKEFVGRLNSALQYAGIGDSLCRNVRIPIKGTDMPVGDGFVAMVDESGDYELDECKELTFENEYIWNAISKAFDTYGVPFAVRGRRIIFGETPIMADCKLEYGADNELLKITKTNQNNLVVRETTGLGSSENIPYYYPNDTEYGTIDVAATEGNAVLTTGMVNVNRVGKLIAKVAEGERLTYRYVTFVESEAIPIGDAGKVWTLTDGYGNATNCKQGGGQGITNVATVPSIQQMGVGMQPECQMRFQFLVRGVSKPNFTLWMRRYKSAQSGTPTDSTAKNMAAQAWAHNAQIIGNGLEAPIGAVKRNNRFEAEDALAPGLYTFTCRLNAYDEETSFSLTSIEIESDGADTSYWECNGQIFRQIGMLGLGINGELGADANGDSIEWTSRDRMPFQTRLVVPKYRNTMGAERFYKALNRVTGEYANAYRAENGVPYVFPNPYREGNPSQHIYEDDSIKPTIEGIRNDEIDPETGLGKLFGEIADIAYDENDNDSLKSGDEDRDNAEYEHSFFYIKLRRMDYVRNGVDYSLDLFNMASQTDAMTIQMTSGRCAGCKFKIQAAVITRDGLEVWQNPVQASESGEIYPGDQAEKINKRNIQAWQQDTSAREVWVAVQKDTETFGVLMPNRTNQYFPSEGDTFNIINIDLPKCYILDAERRLEKAMMKNMRENNDEKWEFDVEISRVWLAEHKNVLDTLDEYCTIPIVYDGKEYVRYVTALTIESKDKDALPELKLTLAGEIDRNDDFVQKTVAQAVSIVNGLVPKKAPSTKPFVTENITSTGSVGASSETGQSILDKLKRVDGPESGLDADMLDGRHASEFATKEDLTDYAKITDIPDITNLATKDEIPDVSGFLTDYDVKSISVNGGAQQPLKGSGNVDIKAATSIGGSGHITAGALQSDGTIEVGVESGYSIPSNSKQQGWDAAKALLEELFEKVNLGTDSNPQWTIKAKMSLWTEGFLSAKGVGDGSAEGGIGYEAVQEMIADALAGYNPAATDVNWTDIVGKPDVFSPSAHQHTVADITDLATTLSGYSTTGHKHTKAEITDFAHTHSWNDITSNKPTTLGGYGITDAVPNTRTITAGTGLAGGGTLDADRTISLNATNVGLLQMLSDMFEWQTVGGVRTIKAKASLWTEGFLSAKGVGDGSAEGISYEAVQEMIDDALVGYTPGDGVVEWTDIVGKPDTFAPSSHTHSYLPLTGGTLTGSLSVGGNVGIGTTSPAYKLDVNGGARVADILYFKRHDNDNNTGYIGRAASSTSDIHVTTLGENAIYFITNSAVRMSIAAGGNVGIGTASPASKLHVSGTATANGFAIPNTNGSLTCKDSTGTAFAMVCYNGSNLWIGATETVGYHHAGNTCISGGTTGKVYCCVPSAENYGGTNYEMLHAGNYTDYAVPKTRKVSTSNGLTGGGDLTQDRTIELTDKNVALLAMLDSMFEVSKVNGVDTIKAKMSLWTDGYLSAKGTSSDSSASGLTAEAVQEMIDDALVGYTPGDGVVEWTDIVGKPDTFAPSSHTHTWSSITGNFASLKLQLNGADVDTYNPLASSTKTINVAGVLTTGNYGSYVTKSYIDGLGVSAATATKLQTPRTIFGCSFDGSGDIAVNAAGTMQYLNFRNAANTGTASYIGTVSAGSDALHMTTFGESPIYFLTNSIARLTISAGGNIGLGVSSPTMKLDVAGGMRATDHLYMTHDAPSIFLRSGKSGPYITSSDTNLLLCWHDSTDVWSKTMMAVGSEGNVGIGTTSPAYKLDVNGEARVSDVIYFKRHDNANNTGYIGRAASSTSDIHVTTLGENAIYFITNSAVRMSIAAGGNVGIGTTSPAQKLDVNGSIRMSGSLIPNGTTCDVGTNANPIRYVYAGWMGSASGYALNIGANNGSAISINTAQNVGIGTTSPDAKLHVAGACYSSVGWYTIGYVTAQQSASSSDIRLKDIIGDYGLSVEKIANAPSVRFAWKDSGREDIGSIAQYWQEVSPHSVLTDPHGNLSLQYGKLGLLASISVARRELELEAEVERLKQEVEQLKAQIA